MPGNWAGAALLSKPESRWVLFQKEPQSHRIGGRHCKEQQQLLRLPLMLSSKTLQRELPRERPKEAGAWGKKQNPPCHRFGQPTQGLTAEHSGNEEKEGPHQ
uniref:Uncharacterized protein n=1 Tax=Micrurus lemniscatus lemniscatus TaxID=129467 RepID=A0A2D4HE30_MICLE